MDHPAMGADPARPLPRRAGSRRPRLSRGALPPARRQEIADLAEAVSELHCPTGRVDPGTIADNKGITLSYGDYGTAFDGMLEHRAGRFHIYCNTARTGLPDSPRARFTVAHELGHYYLDEHRLALVAQRVAPHPSHCDFESSLLAELEADHFAANLLMPERRFRRSVAGLGVGFGAVLTLADAYGASLTSVAVRYVTVHPLPCAAVKWHWQRHEWKCFSSSMFRRRFQRVFGAPARLPEESATRLALAQAEPPACGYFQSGTLASLWFPYVRREDALDVVLVEEAVPMGRYGALTMLYPRPDCPVFGPGRRRLAHA